MQTLREFFTSSSGLAPVRQGLGLGWVISALVGVAILIGAEEAEAGPPNCPGTVTYCAYAYPTHCTKYYPTRCCVYSLDHNCRSTLARILLLHSLRAISY